MKSQEELGLPLEYQKIPEYFDAHNVSQDTEEKNAVIEKLLKEQKVNTVLDLTCGTGSQVFFLTKHGYKITGADFSPELLNIARKKAKQNHIDVTFIDGDMRHLKVGQFDAVISIFNAIGHLTIADFEMALQNIRSNLKENGIYVFDIFNKHAITEEVIGDFAMDIDNVINGVRVHNTQYSKIDAHSGLLTSYDKYRIFKDPDNPKAISHKFSLQTYSAQQLQEILTKNGFKTLSQYSMDGKEFKENSTLNILTVAQKQS